MGISSLGATSLVLMNQKPTTKLVQKIENKKTTQKKESQPSSISNFLSAIKNTIEPIPEYKVKNQDIIKKVWNFDIKGHISNPGIEQPLSKNFNNFWFDTTASSSFFTLSYIPSNDSKLQEFRSSIGLKKDETFGSFFNKLVQPRSKADKTKFNKIKMNISLPFKRMQDIDSEGSSDFSIQAALDMFWETQINQWVNDQFRAAGFGNQERSLWVKFFKKDLERKEPSPQKKIWYQKTLSTTNWEEVSKSNSGQIFTTTGSGVFYKPTWTLTFTDLQEAWLQANKDFYEVFGQPK